MQLAPPVSPPAFGSAGQLVLSSDVQGSLQVQTSDIASTVTTITVGPAADYFLLRSFSVGAHALWEHTGVSGVPSTDAWIAGVRVGYALRLGGSFSFWPRANVDFQHTSLLTLGTAPDGGIESGEISSDGVAIGVFAPFLFHPVPHFFVGAGPNAQAVVATSGPDKPAVYGLMFTLGGWIGPPGT
jgi:hypothetical protein